MSKGNKYDKRTDTSAVIAQNKSAEAVEETADTQPTEPYLSEEDEAFLHNAVESCVGHVDKFQRFDLAVLKDWVMPNTLPNGALPAHGQVCMVIEVVVPIKNSPAADMADILMIGIIKKSESGKYMQMLQVSARMMRKLEQN